MARRTILRSVVGTAATAVIASGALLVSTPTVQAQEDPVTAVDTTNEETDEQENEKYDVSYPVTTGDRGATITVDPITNAPEGTTYAFNAVVPKGVTIDTATGTVTIAIPEDKTIRSITLPIVIIYSDKSRDTASLAVAVTDKGEETGNGSLDLGSLGGENGGGLFGSLGG